MTVLDASALLAFLFREQGHERVAEVIGQSCMSSVNLAEVLTRFVRDGHAAVAVLTRLRAAIEWVPFAEEHAIVAAELAPLTAPYGLSLGDRACLALALTRGEPAMTADRQWAQLDLGIRVELIR
jgi:PIN domain nuclease of toxin-antitoxin system